MTTPKEPKWAAIRQVKFWRIINSTLEIARQQENVLVIICLEHMRDSYWDTLLDAITDPSIKTPTPEPTTPETPPPLEEIDPQTTNYRSVWRGHCTHQTNQLRREAVLTHLKNTYQKDSRPHGHPEKGWLSTRDLKKHNTISITNKTQSVLRALYREDLIERRPYGTSMRGNFPSTYAWRYKTLDNMVKDNAQPATPDVIEKFTIKQQPSIEETIAQLKAQEPELLTRAEALYPQAKAYILTQTFISDTTLCSHLKCGTTSAKRILEQLEDQGLVTTRQPQFKQRRIVLQPKETK